MGLHWWQKLPESYEPPPRAARVFLTCSCSESRVIRVVDYDGESYWKCESCGGAYSGNPADDLR